MPGERRTVIVIAMTATMMAVEISGGLLLGSMALLADGLHMASHATALAITAFAYIYARKHARDERFSFGTGKVNTLGGFTGAILLAVFAMLMVWESIERFARPVEIAFDQAIIVAILGLLVNAASAVILGGQDQGAGHHHHDHAHHHAVDHNLRAAYLHVLADALTSLLAIAALLAGKFAGLVWMDPAMGVVGAILVARWSVGLLLSTARVLLDHQAAPEMLSTIRQLVEARDHARVTDLHLWNIGPGRYAAIISVASSDPAPPDAYKALIPEDLGIVHLTVEVNPSAPGDTETPLSA